MTIRVAYPRLMKVIRRFEEEYPAFDVDISLEELEDDEESDDPVVARVYNEDVETPLVVINTRLTEDGLAAALASALALIVFGAPTSDEAKALEVRLQGEPARACLH